MIAIGRKHITTEEDISRLKTLYNEGWTYKEISEKIGLSKTWVSDNCRKLIKKKELNDRKLVEQKEIEFQDKVDIGKIVALYKAGWNVNDIAMEMYLNPKQVQQILKEE